MLASVNLFSTKENEINKFLDSFYQKKVDTNDLLSWSKEYNNPNTTEKRREEIIRQRIEVGRNGFLPIVD